MAEDPLKALLLRLHVERATEVLVQRIAAPADPSRPYQAITGTTTTGQSLTITRDEYSLLVKNGAAED